MHSGIMFIGAFLSGIETLAVIVMYVSTVRLNHKIIESGVDIPLDDVVVYYFMFAISFTVFLYLLIRGIHLYKEEKEQELNVTKSLEMYQTMQNKER